MHIQITETEYDFLKIISSVFIGMFGKSIFDYFKILRENKKNRNFVIDYLKSAENVFPILTLEYNKLKEYINTDNNGNETGIIKIKLFEDFNTDILKSITFPNYYKLFNILTENIDIKLNEVNILKEKVALFLKD